MENSNLVELKLHDALERALSDGKITLAEIPNLTVVGIVFLRDALNLTGDQKKAMLIRCLQRLCPSPVIDSIIPATIDILWTLIKSHPEWRPEKRSSWCSFFWCCRCRK